MAEIRPFPASQRQFRRWFSRRLNTSTERVFVLFSSNLAGLHSSPPCAAWIAVSDDRNVSVSIHHLTPSILVPISPSFLVSSGSPSFLRTRFASPMVTW